MAVAKGSTKRGKKAADISDESTYESSANEESEHEEAGPSKKRGRPHRRILGAKGGSSLEEDEGESLQFTDDEEADRRGRGKKKAPSLPPVKNLPAPPAISSAKTEAKAKPAKAKSPKSSVSSASSSSPSPTSSTSSSSSSSKLSAGIKKKGISDYCNVNSIRVQSWTLEEMQLLEQGVVEYVYNIIVVLLCVFTTLITRVSSIIASVVFPLSIIFNFFRVRSVSIPRVASGASSGTIMIRFKYVNSLCRHSCCFFVTKIILVVIFCVCSSFSIHACMDAAYRSTTRNS